MEWISTTAKSVPEAIDLALDNLGVDEAEAEIVVVEEPKQGFFGRAKGVARVEARVKPKTVRNKNDRKRRNSNRSGGNKKQNNNRSNNNRSNNRNRNNNNNRSNNQNRQRNNSDDRPRPNSSIEEVSDFISNYMNGLIDAFGIDDNVKVTGDAEEGLTVGVEGQHGLLVGSKGRTLNSIQELLRVSTQRSKPSEYRIYVDVGGYREKRREALIHFATEAAEKAKSESVEVVLDPMNSADRKVIHDALTDDPDVSTRSAGQEPRRRVIVVPGEAE